MKKVIVICVVTGIVGCSLFGDGWSADMKVTSVIAYGDTNRILIYTDGTATHYADNLPGKWEIVLSDKTLLNHIYATAMTALVTDRQIQLWWTEEIGTWNYHRAKVILLK